MEVTINSDNVNDYRLGTFPNVTRMLWSVKEEIYGDVLARFPNVIAFCCSGMQLTSLRGIGELTDLQSLVCHKNRLTSLQDINGLTNLRELSCYDNKLTSLQGIDGLINLQTLDCDGNRITSLQSISGLTNLQDLYCRYNQLTSLQGISGLVNLQEVYCGNNQLTSLQDISGLTKLKSLRCYDNQLASLQGIDGLTNLQELRCGDNRLTSLRNISGLTNLRTLYCSDNQVTSLHDVSVLTNLRELYCRKNRITSLDPIIYLRRLRYFVHDGNLIENPSVQVQRFLERFRQQHITGSSTTIYDDRQNVHDVTIQTSTRTSLSNLMRDVTDEFDLTDVLQSSLSEASRNAITEYCGDNAIHSYFLVTYQELFSRVWNRIMKNEHREELLRILDEQIQDAECKCMTGRFVRTMSVLVGFCDDIVIGISDNSQIAAVIETVRRTIVPYNAQRHADVVRQQLAEMGYDDTQIHPWLEAIMDS